MVKIVLTPDWFLGADVFIDFFSFAVLSIFSLLSVKNYKISKNRSFLYLGLGFIFIGIAQLASVLTKLVLYFNIGPSQQIGQILITNSIVSSVDIFYYLGFFLSRFLTLLGLFVIYRLPRKQKNVEDYILVLYFVLLSALVSKEFYFIYHVTALIFLVLIIGNYYSVYQKNKFPNTKILITAFSVLALSQLIFIFSEVDILFVLAGAVELIGFLILLNLIIRILKNGKEKKQH